MIRFVKALYTLYMTRRQLKQLRQIVEVRNRQIEALQKKLDALDKRM